MGLLSKVAKVALGGAAGFVTGGPAGGVIGAAGGYRSAREQEKIANQERDAEENERERIKAAQRPRRIMPAGTTTPTPADASGFSSQNLLWIVGGLAVVFLVMRRGS